jgi:hypothetical protein
MRTCVAVLLAVVARAHEALEISPYPFGSGMGNMMSTSPRFNANTLIIGDANDYDLILNWPAITTDFLIYMVPCYGNQSSGALFFNSSTTTSSTEAFDLAAWPRGQHYYLRLDNQDGSSDFARLTVVMWNATAGSYMLPMSPMPACDGNLTCAVNMTGAHNHNGHDHGGMSGGGMNGGGMSGGGMSDGMNGGGMNGGGMSGGMNMSNGGMNMDPIEWTGDSSLSRPTVQVRKEPMGGWTVRYSFFEGSINLSAEGASTMTHTPGQGHAHVNVDGVKIARSYCKAVHVPAQMCVGMHSVSVGMYNNAHRPYFNKITINAAERGDMEMIKGSSSFTSNLQTIGGSHKHMGMAMATTVWDGEGIPSVQATAWRDGMGMGWDVQLTVPNFQFDTENPGLPSGEGGAGHAHVFFDGVKLGRLYCRGYFLDPSQATALGDGNEHVLKISLNDNMHRDYTVQGEKVFVELTLPADMMTKCVSSNGGCDAKPKPTKPVLSAAAPLSVGIAGFIASLGLSLVATAC